MDYIGNELELFQFAVNWKTYFSKTMKQYIKGKTLEVGAGIGVNTKYLINDKVTSWTFIEPDEILSSKIEAYTKEIDIPKNIIAGTIQNVESEKFDTIIYIDVLEHIEKSKEEILQIKQMLNDGGYLIILVPAFQFLFNEFDTRLGHYRRYNKKLLRSEINENLYEEKLFYLDSIGVMASVANKLFLKKSEINMSQLKLWDSFMVPLSKVFDVFFLKSFGKSLIGIYKKTQ